MQMIRAGLARAMLQATRNGRAENGVLGGGGRTCRGSARAGQWETPVTSIACGPAKIRGLGCCSIDKPEYQGPDLGVGRRIDKSYYSRVRPFVLRPS
jgi:hypothetical protein